MSVIPLKRVQSRRLILRTVLVVSLLALMSTSLTGCGGKCGAAGNNSGARVLCNAFDF